MRFIRDITNCTSCPLWRGENKTVPGIGPANAKLIFLGEAPGTYEVATRLPFQGVAGRLFNTWLSYSGIVRHNSYVLNCINCQASSNNLSTNEGQAALEQCRAGLLAELYAVAVNNAVLVPMGQTAWEAIFPDQPYGSIGHARGGVYDWQLHNKQFIVIPTLHPQFYGYNTYSMSSFAIWEADGRKIKRISTGGRIVYPKKNYVLFPQFTKTFNIISVLQDSKQLICIDTETSSIDPFEAQLRLLGFAWSQSDALTIPFGTDEFNAEDEVLLKRAVSTLLSCNQQVYQNAIYDAIVMEENGIPFVWSNVRHDIMVLSHVLNPEMRHNLGFIGSIYADIPYHKHMQNSKDIAEYRTYNLDDCTAPLRCLPQMLKDLKEKGLEDLYYNERIKVLKPFARMIQRGIKLDIKRLKDWVQQQQTQQHEYDKELRQIGNLPPEFSLTSASDIRLFLFQTIDAKFTRAKKKLEERTKKIDKFKEELRSLERTVAELTTKPVEKQLNKLLKSTKKKIATKKNQIRRTYNAKCHIELKATAALLSIKPLYPAGSFSGRKTKAKKDMKTDEQNLLSFRNYLNRKLRQLKTPAKRAQVESLLKWLSLYTKYTRVTTLIANYAHLDKWVSPKDKRIHCSINPNGTRTGRPAFSDPNLGTLPKKRGKSLREVFVPEPGYIFLSADYSNAEFIALAYICKEPELIRVVENGLNIHDENTKKVFGITPDHPEWTQRRNVMKTYQFGRIQYGGSDKEIFAKIMIENPDLKMTFTEFSEMNEEYFKICAVQRQWIEETQALALKDRITKTPMGFVRTLYGSERDIKKQAINTPVQGCIAHLINRAMIRIEDRMETDTKAGHYDAYMILQVYDQLIFEVKEGDEDKLIPIIKHEMEKPIDIYGTKVVFPVDISKGYSLGTLKDLKGE